MTWTCWTWRSSTPTPSAAACSLIASTLGQDATLTAGAGDDVEDGVEGLPHRMLPGAAAPLRRRQGEARRANSAPDRPLEYAARAIRCVRRTGATQASHPASRPAARAYASSLSGATRTRPGRDRVARASCLQTRTSTTSGTTRWPSGRSRPRGSYCAVCSGCAGLGDAEETTHDGQGRLNRTRARVGGRLLS
jgi:hypothetical protein